MFQQLLAAQARVGRALARKLPVQGRRHSFAHARGALAAAAQQQVFGAFAVDVDAQVDAIEQRARHPRRVAQTLCGATATRSRGVARVAAGTGIHRREQLKARRIAQPAARPCQGDFTGLQRLAQHVESVSRELGQFVEKEHAAVGQGNLAGPGNRATPDQGGRAGAVMGRSKRAPMCRSDLPLQVVKGVQGELLAGLGEGQNAR